MIPAHEAVRLPGKYKGSPTPYAGLGWGCLKAWASKLHWQWWGIQYHEATPFIGPERANNVVSCCVVGYGKLWTLSSGFLELSQSNCCASWGCPDRAESSVLLWLRGTSVPTCFLPASVSLPEGFVTHFYPNDTRSRPSLAFIAKRTLRSGGVNNFSCDSFCLLQWRQGTHNEFQNGYFIDLFFFYAQLWKPSIR